MTIMNQLFERGAAGKSWIYINKIETWAWCTSENSKFNELQRKNLFTTITLLQPLFVIPNVHWFLQVQLSVTKAKHILYHQI